MPQQLAGQTPPIAPLPAGIWRWSLGAIALLPLLPTWGSLALLVATARVWQLRWRALLWRPLHWGWGLLGLLLVVTVCFAAQPQAAGLGLANFLPFLILFGATSALVHSPQRVRALSWTLTGPAIALSVLGLGQMLGGWSTPVALAPLLGWTLVPGGNPEGRLASAFMYANIGAVYLTMVLPLALGLWVAAWQRRRWGEGLGLTVGVAAIAAALLLTTSRSAWAIALLTGAGFALYLGWRWLVAAAVAIAAVIAGAAFAPPSGVRAGLRAIVPDYVWLRLSDQLYPDRPLALQRITQWHFAWELATEHPLTGWGLRNFTPLYREQMGVWLGHPHNLALMLLAETGFPATLLLLGLTGWIALRLGRLLLVWPAVAPTPGGPDWREDRLSLFSLGMAFGSCALFNALDVSLFDLRANAIAWILLGAIDGIAYRYRPLLLWQDAETGEVETVQ